jgi:hypothetical protein
LVRPVRPDWIWTPRCGGSSGPHGIPLYVFARLCGPSTTELGQNGDNRSLSRLPEESVNGKVSFADSSLSASASLLEHRPDVFNSQPSGVVIARDFALRRTTGEVSSGPALLGLALSRAARRHRRNPLPAGSQWKSRRTSAQGCPQTVACGPDGVPPTRRPVRPGIDVRVRATFSARDH